MTKIGVGAAVGAVLLGAVALFGWGSVSTTATTSSEAALDGAALFRAKGCATCHTGPDGQALFNEFPSLSNAAAFAGDRKPGMGAEEYLAESIREPYLFISPAFRSGGPTTAMPTLDVSDAEVDALVAYLLGD